MIKRLVQKDQNQKKSEKFWEDNTRKKDKKSRLRAIARTRAKKLKCQKIFSKIKSTKNDQKNSSKEQNQKK